MESPQTTAIVPAHEVLPVVYTEHTHTESRKDLTTGFYIVSFLILLLILIVFGDMLVFILGLLGLAAIYAGYFTEKAANEEHH